LTDHGKGTRRGRDRFLSGRQGLVVQHVSPVNHLRGHAQRVEIDSAAQRQVGLPLSQQLVGRRLVFDAVDEIDVGHESTWW
jgi:hypothetical protein